MIRVRRYLCTACEAVADLPQREPSAEAADEEWGVIVEALAVAGLPLVESAQLAAQGLAEQDLLRATRSLCSFEHGQQQPAPRPTVPKHIPDRQRNELVLAQAGAEGHGVQAVVSETSSVLAGDLEQGSLLAFGQGAWGACRVGVVRHPSA